jgi:hypothetical protein
MTPGKTKQRFVIPVCLPLVAALVLGCAAASDAVDDAITVEVGAESLKAVEMDRSIVLPGTRIPACLDFSATLPSSTTTLTLSNRSMGCSLTIDQPALMLLDEHAIERAREQAGDFDVDGIRGATLELETLDLSTADGARLELSQHVDAVTLVVDGEVLLDHVAASELQADARLTRKLPAPLIDKLKTSLEANQAATADVAISLWLRGSRLADLPDMLNMHLVMQPKLQVNVVDAAL